MQDSTGLANREEKIQSGESTLKKAISISLFLVSFYMAAYSYQSQNQWERELHSLGLVNVQSLDSTIRVDLKYAGVNNFMGEDVYEGLVKCFLRPEAAAKLAHSNKLLKKIRPDLSLLVVDGLRPRRVQKIMWNLVKGTSMQNYVANPRWGSMHNYGCAVDITIIDNNGNRLDMGTPVDYFGILAQIRHENEFLKSGKLTPEQIANRLLLRRVMTEAGFQTIPVEWWHFNAFSKKYVRKNYSIIE